MMKKGIKNNLSAALFLLPYGVFYVTFMIWPVIKGTYVSFYKWNLMGKVRFIGFSNYSKIILDKAFWESLGHSALFALVTTPLFIIVGFLLALICNRETHLKKFYRMAFFVPFVLSVSVISYIAVFTFQAKNGLISQFIHLFGVQKEPYWLSDPVLAWFVIILVTLWWTAGFNMILYLAAMQDVPDELYEAADIDGASGVRKVFSITIPMISPTTKMLILLQVISSFKLFGQPYMITEGGPGSATRPIIEYIYETGFKNNNLGYASAMSFILFLVLALITVVQFKVTKES